MEIYSIQESPNEKNDSQGEVRPQGDAQEKNPIFKSFAARNENNHMETKESENPNKLAATAEKRLRQRGTGEGQTGSSKYLESEIRQDKSKQEPEEPAILRKERV